MPAKSSALRRQRLLDLFQFGLVEVVPAVRLNVETRQVLRTGGNILFRHQRDPRHVGPELLLHFLIDRSLLGAVRGCQAFLNQTVDLFALVVGFIGAHRRHIFGGEERTNGVVEFTRGARPADVVKVVLALIGRRHRFYERGALTGLKCADVGLDADLSELLLQELNNLLGGRVVVARPEIDREAAAVAGFLQEFAGLLRIIGPGTEFLGDCLLYTSDAADE